MVFRMGVVLLCVCWAFVCVGSHSAVPRPDLQPGALQQYDAGSQLDADVGADEQEIEQLARYLQLKELAEQRARLLQRQRFQHREPEFSYSFPPAPPSSFALRPADPGYSADSDGSVSDAGDPSSEDVSLSSRDAPPAPPLSAPRAETDHQPVVNNTPREKPYHQQQVDVQTRLITPHDDGSDMYFIAIVAGCSAAAIVGIIAIGISWYKLQKNAKAAADVEYPAYGVTGPNKEASPTGDRRLAQSAHMYHYQHQKQQIIAMESRTGANERPGSVSEAESEEEGEEGDYTVYECPGLAPTGEMEVKNPLFQDDPTPASPAPKTQEQQVDKPPQQP